MTHLFPIRPSKGLTTSDDPKVPSTVERVALSDESLGVHKISRKTTHNVVNAPGTPNQPERGPAWEAFYPNRSINPSANIPGGFNFYLDFSERLGGSQTHLIGSYRILFEKDFDWVLGGKLPGLFGGIGDASYGCSGGRRENRCQCFNLRLMWRKGGQGEIYAYLPINETNTTILGSVPPKSHVNPDYGISVGRGAFSLASGEWTTIAQRVKLNDIGHANGEMQLWVNGESVINVTGLLYRDEPESSIRGMHFSTFFGGHTEDWASTKDQKAWFKDISGGIV